MSPELVRVKDSSPSSAESSFRELDHVFLQVVSFLILLLFDLFCYFVCCHRWYFDTSKLVINSLKVIYLLFAFLLLSLLMLIAPKASESLFLSVIFYLL